MRQLFSKFWKNAWWLLLLIGPGLALAGLMAAIAAFSTSLHDSDLEHRRVTTDLVGSSLEKYLTRSLGAAAGLAQVPWLVSQVEELGSRPYRPEEVRLVDEAWRKNEIVEPGILSNALSMFLQSLTGAPESPYRECLIADVRGRLIAASNRTEDYDQADDSWWPRGADVGEPDLEERCGSSPVACASIVDVAFDTSAAVTAFAIVVPIVDIACSKGMVGTCSRVMAGMSQPPWRRCLRMRRRPSTASSRVESGARAVSTFGVLNCDSRRSLGQSTAGSGPTTHSAALG